jgi:hypothetical protein
LVRNQREQEHPVRERPRVASNSGWQWGTPFEAIVEEVNLTVIDHYVSVAAELFSAAAESNLLVGRRRERHLEKAVCRGCGRWAPVANGLDGRRR